VDQQESTCSDDSGGGDGENPGPDDASGHAPTDGRQAVNGANADNRAGDGMSGADWDASQGGAEKRDGAGALRAEAAERLKLGNFLAHGVNNAPAAEICSGGNGGVRSQNDGQRNRPQLESMSDLVIKPAVYSAPATMPMVFCASLPP